MTNPASTGATGSQLEAECAAYFLLLLLSGRSLPNYAHTRAKEIRFQQCGAGFPMDDLVIMGVGPGGAQLTIEIQCKRTLRIRRSDPTFRMVIEKMYHSRCSFGFENPNHITAVAVARGSTQISESLQRVIAIAQDCQSLQEFNRLCRSPEVCSRAERAIVTSFDDVLAHLNGEEPDGFVWRLLRGMLVFVLDMSTPGSAAKELVLDRCRELLPFKQQGYAEALWSALIDIAIQANGTGGGLNTGILIDRLARRGLRIRTGNDSNEATGVPNLNPEVDVLSWVRGVKVIDLMSAWYHHNIEAVVLGEEIEHYDIWFQWAGDGVAELVCLDPGFTAGRASVSGQLFEVARINLDRRYKAGEVIRINVVIKAEAVSVPDKPYLGMRVPEYLSANCTLSTFVLFARNCGVVSYWAQAHRPMDDPIPIYRSEEIDVEHDRRIDIKFPWRNGERYCICWSFG